MTKLDKKLAVLAHPERFAILRVVMKLGVAERREVLRALGLDDEPLGADWQRIADGLRHLRDAGLVIEHRGMRPEPNRYVANEEEYQEMLNELAGLGA